MSSDPTSEIVTIEGPDWALDVWPEAGGALVAARARIGGAWHTLTRPLADDALSHRNPRLLGGFVMAPFCNRLDQGRFEFEGQSIRAPLNWAADPALSIHGLSWQRPWTIADRTATSLSLAQTVDEPDCDLRYDAMLVFQAHGLKRGECLTTLSVENRSARKRPYGIGFHPYFRRAAGATLAFAAEGQLVADARLFPAKWRQLAPVESAVNGLPLEVFTGLDASFTGWKRRARLTFPDIGGALTIDASESAPLLHVYVPDVKPGASTPPGYLCIEPVSHVTDVHNRRQFANYGDLVTLGPGEALQMTMGWTVSGL